MSKVESRPKHYLTYGERRLLNKSYRKSVGLIYYPERGYDVKKPWQQRPLHFRFFRPLFSIFRGFSKFRTSFNLNKLYRMHLHHLYDFVYQFDIHEKSKKGRPKSHFYFRKLNLLAMRSFYGIFHHSKYVRLLKKKAKADDFQSFLFSLMERRLDVLLYRCGFARSIYSAQQLVRYGSVTVEGRIVRNFYYPIKFFEYVSFSSDVLKNKMQYIYFLQLSSRRMLFPNIPYITINFDFMFFFIRPIMDAEESVHLPYKLDHYTLSSK